MKRRLKNNGSGPNNIMSKLAGEKKKGIIAFGLIAVMVFMWVRVLGGKGPQAADAPPVPNEMTEQKQPNTELKVSFIELPNVKGRNDALAGDFFAGRNRDNAAEVKVISKDGSEEYTKRIADKLKLDAVESGESPRVFINDKLLAAGDKFFVTDNGSKYECEVLGIEGNTVFIKCGQAKITLKLAQESEVTD